MYVYGKYVLVIYPRKHEYKVALYTRIASELSAQGNDSTEDF